MPNKRFFIFCLLLLLNLTVTAATTPLPLSFWGYQAIERWETRGLIPFAFTHSKPFTRAEFAEYLQPVLDQYRAKPGLFSRTERDMLLELVREFREELNLEPAEIAGEQWTPRMRHWLDSPAFSWIPSPFYQNLRNALTLQHGEFNLFADPIGAWQSYQLADENGELQTITRMSNGLTFRGNLGPRFGFYFDLTDNHIVDDRFKNGRTIPEVLEESGWPFVTRGDNGSYDMDQNLAGLTYSSEHFFFLFGRDYNSWGVGHDGNLLLSANAPLYDQVKFVIRYWRFKYTHITAALNYVDQRYRVTMKEQPFTQVYWAGNRLEFYAGRGWRLGLSEAVIYGDRPLQIGYLTPVSFYKSLEHYYGDRDNGIISLDASWRIRSGIKIYGEWLIDDMTSRKLGSDFFGNKFGWQAGLQWVNWLGLRDLDLLAEYTRIKPYVYSQSYRDYNKYKHYDTILGHYIGPNSDDITIRLKKYFSRRLQVEAGFERYRHGSNTDSLNHGGDPDLAFRFGKDNRDAPFLQGLRNTQTAWSVEVTYEWVRGLESRFLFSRFKWDNRNWENMVAVRVGFNFGQRQENFKKVFPLSH